MDNVCDLVVQPLYVPLYSEGASVSLLRTEEGRPREGLGDIYVVHCINMESGLRAVNSPTVLKSTLPCGRWALVKFDQLMLRVTSVIQARPFLSSTAGLTPYQ